MKIKFLGCQGGVTNTSKATSFLINDNFLIDAGCVAAALPVEEQAKIDHIFITHSHLDHTKDLGFICDNCYGIKKGSFKVYSHKTTLENIKNHIFNDHIWPNFSVIPNGGVPTIEFLEVIPEEVVERDGMKVTPILVNHPGNTCGFLFDDGESSIAFTSDTSSTTRFWELIGKQKNLKAIVSEISFPNELQRVADASYHHTPESFKEEMKLMPHGVPIYTTHLKPAHRETVIKQVEELGINITVVAEDGLELEI